VHPPREDVERWPNQRSRKNRLPRAVFFGLDIDRRDRGLRVKSIRYAHQLDPQRGTPTRWSRSRAGYDPIGQEQGQGWLTRSERRRAA